jgi:hypothetical protein
LFTPYVSLVLVDLVANTRVRDGQDEDIDVIHGQLEQEYGAANFEAFINLMV